MAGAFLCSMASYGYDYRIVENYYGQMDELARVYDLDPKL
jgi:hypothetical protein